METEAEFIERRADGHRRAAIEAEDDPLIREVFGPRKPLVIDERQRRAYCYPDGFMFRPQAGDPRPLTARSVSADTVTAVTESPEWLLPKSSSYSRLSSWLGYALARLLDSTSCLAALTKITRIKRLS